MYSLKQADILAYNQIKSVKPHGYHPVFNITWLWKYESWSICFYLCVDNFGITYYNKVDIDHLLDKIGKVYNYTTDWDRKNYCGMILNWNYDKGCIEISMPRYV